jgi:hypothetical protein
MYSPVGSVVKKFKFKIEGGPEEKLQQVKIEAAKNGIAFQGNGVKGKFFGSFVIGRLIGSYKVEKGIITVSITEKPCIATWPMIEQQLRQFLEG